MKSKLLGLMTIMASLGLFPSAGHAVNFDFSFTGGCNVAGSPCTVTGEIDGLAASGSSAATAVIIDTVSSSAFTLPSPLPFNTFCGSNCLVTSNTFAVTGSSITGFYFEVTGTTSLWSLALGAIAGEESFSNGTGETQINVINQSSDDVRFTEITSTTPLPAAFPLFASGLGVIGLLGARKRRKAQAA